MLLQGQQRTCVAICTPVPGRDVGGRLVLDTISPLWHRHRQAMAMPTNFNSVELPVDFLEVGDARSRVARRCLDLESKPSFLLFVDYDVLVPADCLTKLFFRARTRPAYDIYAGVYCLKRAAMPEPLIYGEHGQGPLWDWTVGDILTTESHGVKSVHMGLTLIRVSLFQRLLDAGLVTGDGTDQEGTPFFKTIERARQVKGGAAVTVHGTEDIWFCDLVARLGGKILVDTSVLAGHHDKATGITYGLPGHDGGPVDRAKWLPDGKGGTADREEEECYCLCDMNPLQAVDSTGFTALSCTGKAGRPIRIGPVGSTSVMETLQYAIKNCPDCKGTGKIRFKLALDLGAGGTRRQWPGHKTYTTDVRADTKPDYVQDTRLLNLPDEHYDLIASSHHLEHLGRWDQEGVWREMFRVLKPGGRMEHVVPSLDWAAAKIRDGKVDGHVLNVLYGAQEAHGYDRDFNTHYFGFTKDIARALAEHAGLVDVECRDWRDDPALLYHLIVTGRKPADEIEEGVANGECVGSSRERPGALAEPVAGEHPATCGSGVGVGGAQEHHGPDAQRRVGLHNH